MSLINKKDFFQQFKISKVIVVILLLLLVIFGALPGYLNFKWNWMKPLAVSHLKEIRNILDTGININGWTTSAKEVRQIGEHKWSLQQIQKDEMEGILILLPQKDNKQQPEVEWTDIKGNQRWKIDSEQILEFTSENAKIKARFFRAWNQATFAVIQWYAWKNGGNPRPSGWFFADQIAQFQKKRLGWIAVSIQVKIEPLGEIEKVRPVVESLAKMVQLELMKIF